jgi:3-oxoadipate enol-lactonase
MRTAEVYHEITGEADSPVLVLAGPLGTTLEIWDPLVEALSERFRVLRYDHRGHGRSSAPGGRAGPSQSWIWPSMWWRC